MLLAIQVRGRKEGEEVETEAILEDEALKDADLCVLALHSIPAALRQTVLTVGRQRILLVTVVRLTQTRLKGKRARSKDRQECETREHVLRIIKSKY